MFRCSMQMSSLETIWMNFKSCFMVKSNKNSINLSFSKFAQRVLMLSEFEHNSIY